MWFYRVVLLFLVILTIYDRFSKAYKYVGICENDEVFNDCQDQSDGVLNIHGLFNFSELTFDQKADETYMSGNLTSIWNIQPNDRIQLNGALFTFDRGSWQPTVYSLSIPNFCPIMYDKNQYWYNFWSKYIENKKDVKNKCLLPGTKFLHPPYNLIFSFESPYSKMDGLYKLVVKLKAFDYLQKSRPTSICFEIKAQLNRQ